MFDSMKWLVVTGVVCVVLLIASLLLFQVETIDGNQVGVMETWGSGVMAEPMQPKTYFLFPGFMYTVHKYDVSSQVYVMNDKPGSGVNKGVAGEEFGKGRERDAYKVQSSEGQDMTISLNVRWRLDPTKIVALHKTVRHDVEEKVIRPVLMRVVKDEATTMKAIDAYSGEGLVKLQAKIQTDLLANKELEERGIIIENFVIEHIELDPKYVEEIKLRQVAVQRELRSVQEEKAALAEAKKAKAEAQANYEKTVVEAERDKAVGVLEAEKKAEQEVLAAEASKKRTVLAAEAEKESGELKAAAIIALGKAEAEAKKLQLGAYAVPGAEAFVKIEVARHLASGFQNIKGYLPENMRINVLSESFQKSLKAVIETDSGGDK